MDAAMIRIDRHRRVPLHLQIKHQLQEMILGGTLLEGKSLPPTRKLARSLGVNRSTVVEAYSELMAEGLVDARVGRGTVVLGRTFAEKRALPTQPLNWPELFTVLSGSDYDVLIKDTLDQLAQEDVISLAAGVPAPESYPIRQFQEITAELLRKKGRDAFQCLPTEGYGPLRDIAAQEMAEEVNPVRPSDVLITSGAIQGLYLLAKTVVEPGDPVVVESPTFMLALQIFRSFGARIMDIPVDAEGMRVDMLENLLARQRPKIIYCLPTFQNPSGATLSLERRKKILDLAYRYQVPLIEEDPYGKIYFKDPPPPALKTLDRHNHVIYLGTFSKVLFPGLRIGWVAAPRPVIERLVRVKQHLDLHSNSLGQRAIYEFCRRGFLERHLMGVRKVYVRRKESMIDALKKYCAGFLEWNDPPGGYYLWCRLKRGLPTRDLLRELFYEKVAVLSGEMFFPEGKGSDRFRLNFTSQNEKTIEEGVRRIGRALRRLDRKSATRPERPEYASRPIV